MSTIPSSDRSHGHDQQFGPSRFVRDRARLVFATRGLDKTRTISGGDTSRAAGLTRVGCFDFLFPIRLGEAEIRVVPPAEVRTLRVRFILRTFKLANENDFSETSAPGLNGAPLQFVRSHSRTLSTVLYFDGRATNTDVRQSMKQVTDLMSVDRHTHTPPVLSFEWAGFSLRCVLQSSTVGSFSSLFPDGRPSRGRMHVTFRESLTLQELLHEAGRE